MIRVLVVDDSVVARDMLVRVLSEDPRIEVVGTAGSGAEALQLTRRLRPDVITMAIVMPGMDGYEATRRIMEVQPTPIVIVTSSFQYADTAKTFAATQAGAVAILEKPPGPNGPRHDERVRELLDTVRAMAEVIVVRRWARLAGRPAPEQALANVPEFEPAAIAVVAVGISTGGPPVLRTILSALPASFPYPILIVQHIAAGFLEGLVDWLNPASPLSIQIPVNGEQALAGHAYLAPEGFQMGVRPTGQLTLIPDRPEHGHRPSVSYLFRSVAQSYGRRALAALLTGMGTDGAAELLELRHKGAVTIAQDRESSAIFGMPGEAVKLGAATHVLSPDGIVRLLRRLCLAQRA